MTQDAKTIEAIAHRWAHAAYCKALGHSFEDIDAIKAELHRALQDGEATEGATNDLLTKLWFIAGKLEPSVREDIASIIVALRAALTRNAEPVVASEAVDLSFQARVDPWLMSCFGREIARDKVERNHRFLEEALELVQSGGCTASEAHQLVDYVFGREVGDMNQEVGGVMNTLAALCLAHDLNMHEAGDTELARIWTKIDKIRAKQAAKPKHSPLPEHSSATPPVAQTGTVGICTSCKGTGQMADYIGSGMRCVETGCWKCNGTGRLSAPTVEEKGL